MKWSSIENVLFFSMTGCLLLSVTMLFATLILEIKTINLLKYGFGFVGVALVCFILLILVWFISFRRFR